MLEIGGYLGAVTVAAAKGRLERLRGWLQRCWYPPADWGRTDGCTAVENYHYFVACRRHDWRWRYAGRLICGRLVGTLGILGQALSAPVAIAVMLASNVHFFFDMLSDNWRAGVRPWNLWWWLIVPVIRTAAVMLTGFVLYRPLGRSRRPGCR